MGSVTPPILFFDAGPVISLVISRLDWILPKLKVQFGGKFYITPAVQHELVTRPIAVHRFQFEALQVMKLIRDGVFEVYTDVPQKRAAQLISLANSSFKINGQTMDIIQSGEVESVACALELGAAGVVMDERTLRLFVEKSSAMEKLLESRFQQDVETDAAKMAQFSAAAKGVTIIRSIELVAVAYKLGLLDSYIPEGKEGRDTLLSSVLWAVKYGGCAVSEHEVEEMKEELL